MRESPLLLPRRSVLPLAAERPPPLLDLCPPSEQVLEDVLGPVAHRQRQGGHVHRLVVLQEQEQEQQQDAAGARRWSVKQTLQALTAV